ncbi:unnamed protein product [Prorocentrum cordatum]|uniref:Uncharacterized protein n=1 Tax=Prorocentrum cordatum TaxID=2364126 RepID=A0ABN9Y1I9_9DINO|nr:unnamed protein product [Polarella glacialis]
MRRLRWWLIAIIVASSDLVSAGREPLPPLGSAPMIKRGPPAWGNYATVHQFLEFCIRRGWQLTSELEADRALADCMDIRCYGERKRATLRSVVLFGLLVSWPELRNRLPLALRSLKKWQKLAGTSEGGPLPEEAIYAIVIYMFEHGHYLEGVWTLTQYDVYGREQEVKTGTNQGAVIRRGVVANLALGLRDFQTGKEERLFGTDQVRFRKLWHQACRALGMPWALPPHGIRHSGPSEDVARGRATLEQVGRRGRWEALSSVQRYSKTLALAQFRARMPQVALEAGSQAARDLQAEVLRAIRCRSAPRGSLPKLLEDAVRESLAKDVAAELLKTKAPRSRRSSLARNNDSDDLGGLFSDETFGENTGCGEWKFELQSQMELLCDRDLGGGGI